MPNTQQTSSSHGKLIAVAVAAALVIILAVLSAFVWPGWAIKSADDPAQSEQQTEEPTTPSIDAVALPEDATELLKAMLDSVLNYARVNAEASTSWSSASPLEEYTVTYAVSEDSQDLTMITAQWSSADSAKSQYDAVAGTLTGEELASGNVKVSGDTTGSYVVKTDASDETKAVALWQNDTVVFQVTGSKDAVMRFYQEFPL